MKKQKKKPKRVFHTLSSGTEGYIIYADLNPVIFLPDLIVVGTLEPSQWRYEGSITLPNEVSQLLGQAGKFIVKLERLIDNQVFVSRLINCVAHTDPITQVTKICPERSILWRPKAIDEQDPNWRPKTITLESYENTTD